MDSVHLNNVKMKQARYNDGKMKSPIVQSAKPDRDYRIFYLLMTLGAFSVVAIVFNHTGSE